MLKVIIPLSALSLFSLPTVDPVIVHLVIKLFVAPPINCIVEAAAFVLVLLIVRLFPPVFSPLIVTLSAPLRFIRAPAIEPDIVLAAPPDGEIVTEV